MYVDDVRDEFVSEFMNGIFKNKLGLLASNFSGQKNVGSIVFEMP